VRKCQKCGAQFIENGRRRYCGHCDNRYADPCELPDGSYCNIKPWINLNREAERFASRCTWRMEGHTGAMRADLPASIQRAYSRWFHICGKSRMDPLKMLHQIVTTHAKCGPLAKGYRWPSERALWRELVVAVSYPTMKAGYRVCADSVFRFAESRAERMRPYIEAAMEHHYRVVAVKARETRRRNNPIGETVRKLSGPGGVQFFQAMAMASTVPHSGPRRQT